MGFGLQPDAQGLAPEGTPGQELTGLLDKEGADDVGESNVSMRHSPAKDSSTQPLKVPKASSATVRAKIRSQKSKQPQEESK